MSDKLKIDKWKPDFGPKTLHPTAGVVAIGARDFLIAYNVNLNTTQQRGTHVNGLRGGLTEALNEYLNGGSQETTKEPVKETSKPVTKTSSYSTKETSDAFDDLFNS